MFKFTQNQILPTSSYQVTTNVVAYNNILTLLKNVIYVPVELKHSCRWIYSQSLTRKTGISVLYFANVQMG